MSASGGCRWIMQHIVGSLRRQQQAVCSRFPSCSIDLEMSAPAGAVTATWTTSGRTVVTYKISSGVCCPVGGSSSRAEDSDMVTAHSVAASASPGVARSVCNLGERALMIGVLSSSGTTSIGTATRSSSTGGSAKGIWAPRPVSRRKPSPALWTTGRWHASAPHTSSRL